MPMEVTSRTLSASGVRTAARKSVCVDMAGSYGGSLGLSMQASEGWANLPATTRPLQRVQPEAARAG